MKAYSNRHIWQITYPILISLLMENMIGLTDTAFLGRVGEVELGASALAGVYYMAIFMLGFGFSIGVQILIARRNGEGRLREIGPIFQQGLLFLLFFAAVMFFVSKSFTPLLLRRLIDSDAVYTAAISYLDWRIYGFFFSFAAVLFRAFYVGTTNTRILTANSVVMVLTNVVLNYILIFGKLGCPALGIAGAAIASSAAELVSLLFFAIYTRLKGNPRRYRLFRFRGVNFRELGLIFNVSIWTMMQAFISTATWFLFFLAVEHLGERQLAISNIVQPLVDPFRNDQRIRFNHERPRQYPNGPRRAETGNADRLANRPDVLLGRPSGHGPDGPLPIPRAAHLYRRPIADLRVDRLAVGDGGDLLHPHPEQHAVLRRVGHR